jgi:hypothetical protein
MKTVRAPALALAYAGLLAAQGAPDNDKLLATFQNPVGNLISVPFQNNINFPIGEFSRIQDVLNIQPVIPFHVSEDRLIISRWIIPVIYQPNLGSACRPSGPASTELCETREQDSRPDGGANGLGDMNPTFFLSPAHPGRLIWGFGPTFLLPTATDPTLGQGKWGAGPSIVLLTQPRHWTLGLLSNIWSFAGNRGRRHVNQFLTQYFVTYNMKHGWFVWRRLRKNHAGRYTARGLAVAYVLQRDSPSRRALPEVAGASAGGFVVPGSEVSGT